ncbi:MAG TPA: aspartate ammonia-lyase, partial [Bacteroidales bacterium]|nr:aspartate ammonia-lyase [Bacteroidales bacterium]
MKKDKLNSILSGCAGEYLVAGELSRRGFIASVTLRNSKGVDILVTNEKATKTAAIQVKTRYSKGTAWVMNEKAESYHAPNLFYAF